jgi:hypothetical protein
MKLQSVATVLGFFHFLLLLLHRQEEEKEKQHLTYQLREVPKKMLCHFWYNSRLYLGMDYQNLLVQWGSGLLLDRV